jgi:hypothetical protein
MAGIAQFGELRAIFGELGLSLDKIAGRRSGAPRPCRRHARAGGGAC